MTIPTAFSYINTHWQASNKGGLGYKKSNSKSPTNTSAPNERHGSVVKPSPGRKSLDAPQRCI